ncbi:PREDICTED: caspase-6-like [Amphimedon queenslandica]|uniref:Caspase family p20 domain-containing protein n=1 Tax=Amphimedon queenslandica TaxID=400682 RepID=A0A1X7VW39_AMPQE|nr:PREDICTED: caspase-6-like [Amphimedon queenslandica]|eukprot:XP_011410391.1 PREDICTED: caspase-6-like [Amphimedon queenslandica]
MAESFKLDSSHLPIIEEALKASAFDAAKSFDLGLLLGLSAHIPYERLKSQSLDKSSFQSLLLCYLILWLESGNATAEKLVQSLKCIDEDLAGENIEKLFHPASQLLMSYSDRLSHLRLSDDLVAEMKDLISTSNSNLLAGESLIEACVSIAEDHSKLKVLSDLFQNCDSYKLQVLGKDILKDYEQLSGSVLAKSSLFPNPKAELIVNPIEQSNNENGQPVEFDGPSIAKYEKSRKRPRGVAVIINNVEFEPGTGLENRASSDKDCENLGNLFKDYGYDLVEVKCTRNLKADEMKNKLTSLVPTLQNDHDSFICCILSHGTKDGVQGTDGVAVPIQKLTEIFDGNYCPALINKPKIFFFQFCRGDSTPVCVTLPPKDKPQEKMGFDGSQAPPRMMKLPHNADFLLSYSTSDGTMAMRGPTTGSPYIITLCDAIRKNPKRSIDEILLLVHNKVATGDWGEKYDYQQMPEMISTLRKKFFFK